MNGTTGERERGERRGKRRIMVELVTIPWITHQHGSHLGARLGQGGSNVPSDTGHMIGQTGIPLIYEGTTAGRSKWDEGTTKVLIRTNK